LEKKINSKLTNQNYVFNGGDINFTLGDCEICGSSAQKYTLYNFFIHKLDEANLFDIQTIKYIPTWKNIRMVDDRVAKRIDRFLLPEPFLQGYLHTRQWMASGGISDHNHILLELGKEWRNPPNPFKFNPLWIEY
jgi:hypothetical protein